MRKDAKKEINVRLSHVQGYHAASNYHVSYAYQGWNCNKYFTSDRAIKLDANFNRPDGKPLKGYGLEIETECSTINNDSVYAEMLEKVVFSHFPADLFKLQRDGSLGGRSSAECITQVMTKEFIRNQYAAFKLMYNTYFRGLGIRCDSDNCGMHVNISLANFGNSEKTQEEAVRKFAYLVNHHYDLMRRLVRRIGPTDYCARMQKFITKESAKHVDLRNFPSDHYVCFNLGHYREGRVELRLVGGQKDFGAFRNTMESVFHLVEASKRLSWADCDDLSKVFAGCNQYVYDRLVTCCVNCTGGMTFEQGRAITPTVKREELL